jgi:hypothetical protein
MLLRMSDDRGRGSSDPPKQSLAYAPADLSPRTRAHRYAPLVWAMALTWVLVAMASGVSSDRVLIPLPKKITITAAGIVIVATLAHDADRLWRVGCLFAFLLAAMALIGVMWFWN